MASPQSLRAKIKPTEWYIMGKTTTLLTLDLFNQHLSQLPDDLFELTELEALNLGMNKDIKLSDNLIGLPNLKVLSLYDCNLDTVPAVVMKLEQLEVLYLSNNRNITLPDEMCSLTNVSVLNLGNFNPVPAVVGKLLQLKALYLYNNKKIKLPDERFSLVNLDHLNIYNCDLNTLPPVLLKLLNLQDLDLSNNQISLPDELYKLENMKVLILRGCNLATVPPVVLKLTQLEELDLSENRGIHLPEELSGLTNMRVLKLLATNMDTVPPVVWRLTQLEWLDLSFNPLQTLPAEIGTLNNVKHLDLYICQLSTLPPEVWRLTQLEWLDLRNNPLRKLPAKIGQLTNIKHLDLSNCELRTLPSKVGRLTQLEWLDLSLNSLDALPVEIAQLTNVSHLYVFGNPLIKPPAEVCSEGINAIRQYFDELEHSEEEVSARLKVVVLGEKMAGKTSLVQTLSRGQSSLTKVEDRTHCVEITQWVPDDDNIKFEVYDFGGHDVYHLTHQFFLTQGALNLLTVNLLKYRCTEQGYTEAVGFWLDTLNARVPGAVVTLVCSKTDLCCDTEIGEKIRDIQVRFSQQHDMWTRTMQQQMKKLESNRAANEGTDQGEIEQQLERTRQLLTRPLWITCTGLYCVSSAEPRAGLDKLRGHILETVNDTSLFPSLQRILPRTWMDFERQMHGLRGKGTEKRDFRDITKRDDGDSAIDDSSTEDGTEEYESARSTSDVKPVQSNRSKWLRREECLKQGQLAGLTADRLEPALSYLQQVGTILRYTDIPELRDFVFYDPSGLIDVMKELFHHDLKSIFNNKNPRLKSFSNTHLKKIWKNLSRRGFLPREVVIALLGLHATPVGNVDVITSLMEHFGVCYTEWSEGETSTSVGYYIPWYIKEERPEAINRDFTGQEFIVTCEIAHFCPRGLFERLSVVINKLIKSRQDWKDLVSAVKDSFPVIVYREKKDEHVNIVVRLIVPAQAVQGTQVIWHVIGPLKDKLSALLKEWPGLLYRLVYSTFPQQAKHKGDQQTFARSSIIPTFEVGPRGCTVQHGGVALEFPEGCVRDTRFISVEVEGVPVTEDVRTNFTAMSAVLTVEQDFPQRFLRPVTVRLPWVWTQHSDAVVKHKTITVVLHYNRDEGWTVFQTDTHRVNGGIMFQTDHFQSFWVLNVLHSWLSARTDAVSWARQTWNGYIEDKVYVIVTPDINTLPERTLHLISLYKSDNIHDLYQATGVRFESQIKQRVEMTNDQTIKATFGEDEDVGPDPRDLGEGESMSLRPPTRRSVRLRVKESVPQKPIYEGKVKFAVTDEANQTGATERPQFEAFVKLRRKGWPNLLSPLIFVAIVIAALAVAFQLYSTGYIHGFWAQVDGGGHVPQHTSYSGKAVVLLVNDEYGTSKGGISTINRQLAKLLRSSGAKALCTVLNASEEDVNDARTDGVELVFPTSFKADKRQPTLDWLTWDHQIRYPNLSPDITHIIGHASITSRAARNIRKDRLPLAKFILFNHVMPEDTEHHKSDDKVMSIEDKMDAIRKDTEEADVVFSVGPTMHDYYKNQIRLSKPHHLFLPKPSDIFSQMDVTYVETETKVVLCVGRVKGVEKLKGYDLVAKAMDKVLGRFPKAILRVRGVSAEDFPESKEIIQANMEKGTFHFTPLKYGTQQQLSRDFKEAHLVLMPSRAEPFGLVGLEAIAAGVPTIVSDQSGLAMFLKAQDDVIFDRPIVKIKGNDEEDAARLADRIVEILENGSKEFKAAKELKQKLLASKYWEESHRKFLEECGIQK